MFARADMVHCDIKPQNLCFFSSSGTWKLIDLATVCEEGEEVHIHYSLRCDRRSTAFKDLARSSQACVADDPPKRRHHNLCPRCHSGNPLIECSGGLPLHAPRYCAPEVLLHVLSGATTIQRVAAHDMWSVGVIMYELFTGRRLFGEALTDAEVKIMVCSVSVLPPFAQLSCWLSGQSGSNPAMSFCPKRHKQDTKPLHPTMLSSSEGLHCFSMRAEVCNRWSVCGIQ